MVSHRRLYRKKRIENYDHKQIQESQKETLLTMYEAEFDFALIRTLQ